MKKRIFICIFTLISTAVFSQNEPLLPFRSNGLWGFINMHGKVVIPAEYDAVDPFQYNGRNGEYARLTKAVKNGKVYIINNINEIIAKTDFEDVHFLNDTILAVKKGPLWGAITTHGRDLVPLAYQALHYLKAYNYFYLKSTTGSGLADINGQIFIPLAYDTIRSTADGFYTRIKGKQGFISPDKKEILEAQYDSVFQAGGNTFFFETGDTWAAVNEKKDTVLKKQWQGPECISPYFVKLHRGNNMAIYATTTGKLIPCLENKTYKPLNFEYLLVSEEDSLSLLHASGEVLVKAGDYESITFFDSLFFRVGKDNYYGLVNKKGKTILSPIYTNIEAFIKNVALVHTDDGWGLVNAKGKQIIPCKKESIELYEGRAKAWDKNGLHVYEFDENGELTDNQVFTHVLKISVKSRINNVTDDKVKPLAYTKGIKTNTNNPSGSGAGWFCKDKKWGLKDSSGTVRIPPYFSSISKIPGTHYTLCGVKIVNRPYGIGGFVSYFQELKAIVADSIFKMIIPPKYLVIDIDPFNKADFKFTRAIGTDGFYVTINRYGQVSKMKYNYIDAVLPTNTRFYKGGRLVFKEIKDVGSFSQSNEEIFQLPLRTILANPVIYDFKEQRDWRFTLDKGKWGYFNKEGEVRFETDYNFAAGYRHGTAIVTKNDRWGVINEIGTEVLPIIYLLVKRLEGAEEMYFKVKSDNPRYGSIDLKGDLINEVGYDQLGLYHEGKAWAKKHGKFGFIDGAFHNLGDTSFNAVQDFSEGFAAVRKGYRWGFVNTAINIEIPCTFTKVGNFHNSLAWAMDKGKYGYIGTDGKWAIKPVYLAGGDFTDNGLAIIRTENYWGLINKAGKTVLSGFDKIAPFSDGIAIGQKSRRFVLIDSNGRAYCTLNGYNRVFQFHDGYARVESHGKYGFIDNEGKIVIKPSYPLCTDVHEGISLVGIDEKKMILSVDDTIKNHKKMEIIYPFSEGFAVIKNQSRYNFINSRGEIAIPENYNAAKSFKNGLARVYFNNSCALINHEGLIVVAPKYNDISEFSEGRAVVKLSGFYGIADLHGHFIIPAEYEYINLMAEKVFQLQRANQVGYLKSDGTWLWAMGE